MTKKFDLQNFINGKQTGEHRHEYTEKAQRHRNDCHGGGHGNLTDGL
jgi:hypothetical protein